MFFSNKLEMGTRCVFVEFVLRTPVFSGLYGI